MGWENLFEPTVSAALAVHDRKECAGVVEPLVKLVEAGPEGKAGQDSDSFKAEMVQHLLTLQVSHPQLREAIQEVTSSLKLCFCNSKGNTSFEHMFTGDTSFGKVFLQMRG